MTDRDKLRELVEYILENFITTLNERVSFGSVTVYRGEEDYLSIGQGIVEYTYNSIGFDINIDGEDTPNIDAFIYNIEEELKRYLDIHNYKVVINPESTHPYEVCKIEGEIEMIEAFESDTDAVAFIAGKED